MSLPIKQLLMPRYMVIAPYPDTVFNIGEIIIQYYIEENQPLYNMDEFAKYPHLFRPMPWYEGRKVEDMPKYLKLILTHGTRFFNIEPSNYLDKEFMKWKFGGHTLKDFLPATEEEYISHINKTK